jgi:hypothetical protein
MLYLTVVQCNIEEFDCGNQCGKGKISSEKRHKKFRMWFPGVSVFSKLSMSESLRRSFPALTLICSKLCCMLCAEMQGYKFCRGSGFGVS